jgi:hypothetical protein
MNSCTAPDSILIATLHPLKDTLPKDDYPKLTPKWWCRKSKHIRASIGGNMLWLVLPKQTQILTMEASSHTASEVNQWVRGSIGLRRSKRDNDSATGVSESEGVRATGTSKLRIRRTRRVHGGLPPNAWAASQSKQGAPITRSWTTRRSSVLGSQTWNRSKKKLRIRREKLRPRCESSYLRFGWRRPPWPKRRATAARDRPSKLQVKPRRMRQGWLGSPEEFNDKLQGDRPPRWWPRRRDATRWSGSAPGVIPRAPPVTPRRTGATPSVRPRTRSRAWCVWAGRLVVVLGPWRRTGEGHGLAVVCGRVGLDTTFTLFF